MCPLPWILYPVLRYNAFKSTDCVFQDLMSSAATLPRSSPQHPKESDVAGKKLACGNLNAEEKANSEKSDLRITGFIKDIVITSIPHPVPYGETQCEWIAEPSAKAKVTNLPGYPARIPKPRRPDLYTIRSTPDIGKGLFAKHDIKRGELILAERPLVVDFVEPPGVVKNNYTLDRQILTKYESVLEAAIARLPPESQDDFRALHNNHLTMTGSDLFGITRTNRYGFPRSDDGSKKDEKYAAVFKIASRINHSCMPNVLSYSKLSSFSLQFYAIRDIKAGEQLFSSYSPIEKSHSQRRVDHLLSGFICKCPACVNATPETDQLRNTFKNEIDRFVTKLRNPSETLLENAMTLEKDLLTEGLDASFKFGTLLQVICVAFANLGKAQESETYLALVREFRFSLKMDEK